ncbi:MAG: hypothetical protein QNJ90_05000 [Planctomycetota bacterium]|nr:hypothetical protein [Planctomycetota bacterium]
MARKATDLLDVFRFGDDDGGDDHARDSGRGASKKKPKREKPAPKRKRAQGLILNRRQVVLGSSAVALLLVLSFVLGLSAGRTRPGAEEQTPKIERRTPVYIAVQGSLPLLDKATRKKIKPAAVAAILKRDYGLQSDQMRIEPVDGQLQIQLGPFRSRRAAERFVADSGIEMLQLYMEDPFRWWKLVRWRPKR